MKRNNIEASLDDNNSDLEKNYFIKKAKSLMNFFHSSVRPSSEEFGDQPIVLNQVSSKNGNNNTECSLVIKSCLNDDHVFKIPAKKPLNERMIFDKLLIKNTLPYNEAIEQGYKSSKKNYRKLLNYMKELNSKLPSPYITTSSPNEPFNRPLSSMSDRSVQSDMSMDTIASSTVSFVNCAPAPEYIDSEKEWIKTIRSPTSDSKTGEKNEIRDLDSFLQKQQSKEHFPILGKEVKDSVQKVMSMEYKEIVVKKFDMEIYAKDVQVLIKGTSILSDVIIKFYGCLIRDYAERRSINIKCLPPTFSTDIGRGRFSKAREYFQDVSICKLDYIWIPIKYGKHWCCFIVFIKENKIEYYDSLHGENMEFFKKIQSFLSEFNTFSQNPIVWTYSAPKVEDL